MAKEAIHNTKDKMYDTKDKMYDTKDKFFATVDDYKSPNVDVLVDLGHPLVNRVVDGFIKVGGVGALNAASQDAYKLVLQEEANRSSLENMVQNMGKQAVQWGMVAGVYSGMKYGMQEARGVRDWKNAMVGGAVAGAALSLTEPNPRHDRVVQAAITGGAIATAA
ncbi:hypothetical protein KI387_014091, partial [Taxus chinensis]